MARHSRPVDAYDHAAARLAEGSTIHVVTLLFADLPVWGYLIQAIEGAGFRLEHFELAKEGHAVAVFRAGVGS